MDKAVEQAIEHMEETIVRDLKKRMDDAHPFWVSEISVDLTPRSKRGDAKVVLHLKFEEPKPRGVRGWSELFLHLDALFDWVRHRVNKEYDALRQRDSV